MRFRYNKAGGVAEEALSAIRVIASFGGEKSAGSGRWRKEGTSGTGMQKYIRAREEQEALWIAPSRFRYISFVLCILEVS